MRKILGAQWVDISRVLALAVEENPAGHPIKGWCLKLWLDTPTGVQIIQCNTRDPVDAEQEGNAIESVLNQVSENESLQAGMLGVLYAAHEWVEQNDHDHDPAAVKLRHAVLSYLAAEAQNPPMYGALSVE